LPVAVTSLEVPLRADLGRWDRWRWHWPRAAVPVLMALVLLGVLAGAGARIDYAANYQPLELGGSFGPASAGVRPVNDGFETTRWLLTAKPGATGTFAYGVYNNGSDPVTIDGVAASSYGWISTSARWAPFPHQTDAHALPVVVPPHQYVELLFSIRKPTCPGHGGRDEIRRLAINTRAFGFTHTVALPLSGDLAPIEVCW
jgi:hypothetical protein